MATGDNHKESDMAKKKAAKKKAKKGWSSATLTAYKREKRALINKFNKK